ncbi:MAG: RNA 2',3'-cyclic phosphodiesterase [Thaumarchaeota archaeon]|nr:RNA 2',3'-cyclic phosphodiesterase [Nitrososphaerota archaeon]
MRVFVAIDVGADDIVDRLRQVQENIIRTGADVKLVEPHNMHFTVKFLGEVSEAVVHQVENGLSTLSFKAFNVKYRGLGVFPSPKRISVIWAGVEPDSAVKLNEVAEGVNGALREFSGNDRDSFQPHVTIARVKSGRERERLLEEVQGYSDTFFGEETVSSLKLKKSDLTPKGPIYADLVVLKFG